LISKTKYLCVELTLSYGIIIQWLGLNQLYSKIC